MQPMSLSPLLSVPAPTAAPAPGPAPAAGNTTVEVTCAQLKNMHHALAYARIARHCPDAAASGGSCIYKLTERLVADSMPYFPLYQTSGPLFQATRRSVIDGCW